MPHSDKLRNSMWVSRRAWMLAAAGTACRYTAGIASACEVRLAMDRSALKDVGENRCS